MTPVVMMAVVGALMQCSQEINIFNKSYVG